MDTDMLNYIIEEIKKNTDKPYHMANESMAIEYHPYLLLVFPEIKLVKINNTEQFFYITEKSRRKIVKKLEKYIVEFKEKISDLEKVLARLQ